MNYGPKDLVEDHQYFNEITNGAYLGPTSDPVFCEVVVKIGQRKIPEIIKSVADCFNFPINIQVDFYFVVRSRTRWVPSNLLKISLKIILFRDAASLIYPSIGTCSNDKTDLYTYRDLMSLVNEYMDMNPERILKAHLSTRNYGIFQNNSGLTVENILACKLYIHKFDKNIFQ